MNRLMGIPATLTGSTGTNLEYSGGLSDLPTHAVQVSLRLLLNATTKNLTPAVTDIQGIAE